MNGKGLLTFITIIVMSYTVAEAEVNSGKNSDVDTKISELISKMSVEEKVGQMTQVDLSIIVKGGYDNTDGTIDPELLKRAVNTYKVGSILNAVNNSYDLETWHDILTQIQDAAMENDNKIPVLYGIDAIHGTTYTTNGTLFPHNIGLAAARNPELAKRSAAVTAKEARASGLRWNFDPVLDVARNPQWPRFEETFGEDPVLIAKMALAMIKGYEGDDLSDPKNVAATLKHFMGYGNPRTGRDRTPAYVPEIELREYELPQFKKAVEQGVASVMLNSGEVNGVPVHGSKYFINDILREELGFQGVIVTDWQDVNRLYERHNVVPSMKEAVRLSVLAGIDMSMTPHDFRFFEYLVELYDEDARIAERVDESVARILRLKFDVGLMDNPYPEEEAVANFGSEEYAELALQAARETITLAKNDNNTLPLPKDKNILLAGPGANELTSMHGSWSYTWQGNNPDLYPETTRTIREAIEAKIGAGNVNTISHPQYHHPDNYDIRRLQRAARRADHIVLVLGEESYAESPGSIVDLDLDEEQVALAKAAIETGKPVTVIMLQGRPRVIREFADDVQAIILGYRPGSQGANALADVIFGDYNPGGKLAFSYPRYSNDLVMYDHKWTELNIEDEAGSFTNTGYNPQFEFGHGLSYTTFEYSDFEISSNKLVGDDKLTATVKVRNTGEIAGHEVVELYSRMMHSSVTPSMRRLRKFTKVYLEPGQEKVVEFQVSADDFKYTVYGDEPGTFERKLEEAEVNLMIGGLGFEVEETDGEPYVSRPFKHARSFHYSAE